MAKLSAISASNEKENDNRTNDWAFCYHLPMLRLILTLVLILPISAAMADVTGMARVVDGDTIWIGN
jgi:hypothetical protein